MKKIASLALAAAMAIPAASFSCEITDAELSTGNNPNNIASGVKLWGQIDFDLADVNGFLITANGEPTYAYNFEPVSLNGFVTNHLHLPINTTQEIEVTFSLTDGTESSCSTTVDIPEDNAAPVVVLDRMSHYEHITPTENGVKATVFASIMDTDGNVAAEDIEYELVTAPDGVEVPFIELVASGTYAHTVNMQEIEFTVPGDYSLRVKATDAFGEVAYSYPIEFTIDNCIESSIAEHTLAGRASNVYGSYFTTGAYVYLGYQNGGDVVSLEKIDSLGDWWVICQ